jgi:hypothetical protein
LNASVGHIILKILSLKGQDGETWKDHMWNCMPCHLLDVDGQIDPSLVVVLANFANNKWVVLHGYNKVLHII